MAEEFPAITGVGYSLPATKRGNDAAVFDWLQHHSPPNSDLFKGLKNRYVLSEGEEIATNMVIAAQVAMADAGIVPEEVDGITGYLSNSEYLTPNGLAKVHKLLGLEAHAWVRPVADNFTNFFTGLSMADAAVGRGDARNVIVVCGCNWSTMVDYHTAQAITAGDGAGAVVVGLTSDTSRFRLVSEAMIMDTGDYGSMYLRPEPLLPDGAPPYHGVAPVYTAPYFTLTKLGGEAFKEFGTTAPVDLVQDLLRRNSLNSDDVTLMAYQVSTVLSGVWEAKIKPGQYIDTLEQIANVTLATVPVNLARSYDEIENDWLVAFSMNTSVGVAGSLLQRG